MAESGLKPCFVIAPIGESGSEVRKRSDQVLKYIIEPATKACGYECQRADAMSDPGIITRQVLERLINAPMVVADLTGHNPNVFYELAIRHAIRKPLVQMIEDGQAIPFDVASLRTIRVNYRDLDSVEVARGELERHIRSAENDPSQVDNPISSAIDLTRLRESGGPEAQLATVIEMVGQLAHEIESLRIELQQSARVPIPTANLGDVLATFAGPSPPPMMWHLRTGGGRRATKREAPPKSGQG